MPETRDQLLIIAALRQKPNHHQKNAIQAGTIKTVSFRRFATVEQFN